MFVKKFFVMRLSPYDITTQHLGGRGGYGEDTASMIGSSQEARKESLINS
jgi:hypothetical protein